MEREREEGRGVDHSLDIRHGVGNGLDRDRVDVVVDIVDMSARDALAFQVLLLKALPRWNTASGIQQQSSSRMQTSSQQWLSQNGSARDKTMLDAGDNTINNNCCCYCRQHHA